jgi:hypothetical protein
MDRTQPFVTKLQEGFIGRLVGSLRESYSSSGLIPGIMIDQEVEEDAELNENSGKALSQFIFRIKARH